MTKTGLVIRMAEGKGRERYAGVSMLDERRAELMQHLSRRHDYHVVLSAHKNDGELLAFHGVLYHDVKRTHSVRDYS